MSRVLGAIVTIYGWVTGNVWLARAGQAIMVAGAYNDQRKAKRRAREAYNASLQDRLQMVDLQADAPRTLALGRVRTVEGVRRRWVSGTNSEKLTLVVSFAGHEIDAFEAFYFDDNLLTLDGSGWVTTDRYRKQTLVSALESAPPTGASTVVTLPHTPVAGSVSAVLQYREVSEPTRESPGTVSVAGNVVTVTGYDTGLLLGGAGVAEVIVSYQHNTGGPMARIRPYLGTAGQNVGADLAAEYPGKITATDRFAGIALAVVDLLYDPDVYPQGIPNITAVLRGAKVLDPRTSTTAWSEKPALLAYHYARWSQGWALPAGQIATADIISAADVCDTSTSFTLRDAAGATSVVTLPRHRCGIVISSAADPRSSMDDILESMAGRSGWAGGTWRLRAGTCAAPVATLSQAWLAVPQDDAGAPGASAIRITNGMPREAKLNTVGGRFVDPDQRHQVLPFPAVRDEVLIAADGEYPGELDLAGVNHLAHAQHLASIRIRESMAGLRLELSAGVQAYPVELFDVVTLDLPRYGMPAAFNKRAEVIGWSWHPTTGIGLQLAEIAPDIFTPLAELTGRDPAPNSTFPNPADIEQLTITGVSSSLAPDIDDSVVTRTRVQWTAAVAQGIRAGGNIELQYALADASDADDWATWEEAGSATEATLVGLLSGRTYLFRVRAVKRWQGLRGPWSVQASHSIAGLPAVGIAALTLTPASVTLIPGPSGTVTDFTPARTTATVAAAGVDQSASWAYSGAASGVTFAQSGALSNVFQITGYDPAFINSTYNSVVLQLHGNATDYSRYRRVGTLSGSGYSTPVVAGAFGATVMQFGGASGASNSALTFGPDPSLRIPGNNSVTVKPWSVKLRIRLASALAVGEGIQFGGNNNRSFTYTRLNATDHTLQYYWIGAGASVFAATTTVTLTPGQWYTLEACSPVYGLVRVYVDGVQVASGSNVLGGVWDDQASTENATFRVFFTRTGSGALVDVQIEEVQFAIGAGFATANYTPRTTPWPDGPYVGSAYIDVTATQAGQPDLVQRFVVDTLPAAEATISAALSPSTLVLSADESGVVGSFTGASATATVLVNGADTSSLWTMTATPGAAGITATVSGRTVSITAWPTALATGTVALALSREGYPTQTLTLTVSKVQSAAATLAVQWAPAVVEIQAALNGFIYSYSGAASTASIARGGVDESASWSIASATPRLGGTTVTTAGRTVTVTGLTVDQDVVDVVFSRAGYASIRRELWARKLKQLPNPGVVNNAITQPVTATAAGSAAAGVRFKTDGRIQTTTDGTAWTDAGHWYYPTTAGIGSTHRVQAILRSGSLDGSSSALGVLDVSTDRTYIRSRATPGYEETGISVQLGDATTWLGWVHHALQVNVT